MLVHMLMMASAAAYTLRAPPTASCVRPSPACRSAVGMNAALLIKGTDLEVTEPLKEYADTKIGKPLTVHAEVLNSASPAEVHLKVEHRGVHDADHLGKEAHIADVTVYCKDKAVIHASAESSSMYASLDELADTLSRKLRKHKERRVDVKQKDRREDKNVLNEQVFDDEDDDDDFAAAA